jgi:hypothetical protein
LPNPPVIDPKAGVDPAANAKPEGGGLAGGAVGAGVNDDDGVAPVPNENAAPADIDGV